MNLSDLENRAVTVFPNPRVRPAAPYGAAQAAVIDETGVAAAKQAIAVWPDYGATPLHALPGLARDLGLGALWVKDEGRRFGLGSFKALGGSYAVFRLLARRVAAATGREPDARSLLAGQHRAIAQDFAVTSATDGNHGRSVAWGAKLFGCPCTIYMHEGVSDGRVAAIRALGAEVVRTPGNYDDSVRACAADAARRGRQVVSDTAYEGYTEIPRLVMHGYAVLVDEALAQFPGGALPTHVVIQGGCGGFAAAVYGRLWEKLGAKRPRLVVVEPLNAACLYESARAGRVTVVGGQLATVMGGLACGEVSLVAWPILEPGASAFMTMGDGWAVDAMRRLGEGRGGDPAIVAGEAGSAGVAALMALESQHESRAALDLDGTARVLAIVSEGATDPVTFRSLTGRNP